MPVVKKPDQRKYQCLHCGEKKSPASFYKAAGSRIWNTSEKKALVCKDCVMFIFTDLARVYGDKNALITVCAMLDIPYVASVYTNVKQKTGTFRIEQYMASVSNFASGTRDFCSSIVNNEMGADDYTTVSTNEERKWTADALRSKEFTIEVVGRDPFIGQKEDSRIDMFSEFVKYIDEDTADDRYKLSQIIQIIQNNEQIRRYDEMIAGLDPLSQATQIKAIQELKSACVASNDKIAKENEISVKNRSNKEVGKSTLGYLMEDLRKKGFSAAEVNYYNQLKSDGTRWAVDMSHKSIMQHAMFDENDKQEMFNTQREIIDDLNQKYDAEREKNRMLLLDLEMLRKGVAGE